MWRDEASRSVFRTRHDDCYYYRVCKACYGLTTKSCRMCGQVFQGKPGRRYCSAACRRAARPQTFFRCKQCGKRFGPVAHLRRRYCSQACNYEARRKCEAERLPRAKATPEARRAQRTVAYYLAKGVLSRPSTCEECASDGKIEAAHFDYREPLKVRWLCKSCRARWDWHEPKGGTDRSLGNAESCGNALARF